MSAINGFYTGYFTGAAGNGVALFVMRDGVLVGVDMSGVTFDGNYKADSSSGKLVGKVVTCPP